MYANHSSTPVLQPLERTLPVRLRLGLVAAIAAALVAIPASAQAVAPDNDAYLFSTQINNPGTGLLGSGSTRGEYVEQADNTEATEQSDIFDPDSTGGPQEALYCGLADPPVPSAPYSSFGKTLWWDVHPDVNGYLGVTVTGFDSVLGFTEYDSGANPVGPYPCQDDPNSTSRENMLLTIRGGHHYSIQVGGWAGFVANPGDPFPNTPDSDNNFDFIVDFFPDRDLDGTLDSGDRCPTAVGPSSLRGCPDTDGDGVPNIDDGCDTVRGPKSLGGCPDSDGDGIVDVRDGCDHESSRGKTDRNANGCPDYKSLPDLRASIAGVIKHNRVAGVKFTVLKFRSKAPKGTKLKIKCKPRKTCKLRKKGSLRKRLRSVSFKRKKTKITIKATKSGYVGKVFTLTVTYKKLKGGGRNVILRGPKKRCIPVGGRKTRKCTSSLTLR